MKKWLIILGLLILLFAGGFIVAIKLIMPKAAMRFVPVKWQNIPLGQKKQVVVDYLGEPIIVAGNENTWRQNIDKNKQYELRILFNADTIACRYDIIYKYSMFGIKNSMSVIIDSLK